MSASLAGIELPADIQWTDEFSAWRVGQYVATTLTGARVVQESALQAGRPITLATVRGSRSLSAVVTLATLRQLQALESTPRSTPMVLVLPAHNSGSRSFDVLWRRSDGLALEAAPLKHIVPAFDADLFSITLRLMTA